MISPHTIAAIATPSGMGGIGIIRISGPEALPIGQRLAPRLAKSTHSHHLYRTSLVHPISLIPLDEALAVYMAGPHSFTGEDVVELHCHGGQAHLGEVLEAVLAAGARPAQAGEFTRRAFLNGRLDLLQAEAIADLIEARSRAACRLARRHLEGRLSREIEALSDELATALVHVESAIDFSLEEHVYPLDPAALRARLGSARAEIDRLLHTYDQGRRVRDGIRCVIAGRPNAGKSTLLNRLLAEERAIVSPVPGTTRDYLDADLLLDGRLFCLVDTAGLRRSQDAIEAEGVRRTQRQLETADFVVYVADASLGWTPEESAELAGMGREGLLVWNKTDLPDAQPAPAVPSGWLGPLALSLHEAASGDRLCEMLREVARRLAEPGEESIALSRARHRDALQRARHHLELAMGAVDERLDVELIALDVRLALDAVGEVVGRVAPEDILARVFAEFCIGK